MNVKTRIWIIVAAALVSMTVMAVGGLYQLRQSLLSERRAQITQLLDFADAQLKYFHALETNGKMSREEAQARAKESIAAQKMGSNYFFIRSLTDDIFIYHPVASRMGKADPGAKMPDGRMNSLAYREDLAKSKDNKVFMTVNAARPNNQDKTPQPKLVGVLKFEPWGWMPGIGFYTDDIDRLFWQYAGIFLAIGMALIAGVAFLGIRTTRNILGQLGGEPQYAVEIAQGIANGDLSRSIISKGGAESLLGSMCVMQAGLHKMVERFNKASATLASASLQLAEETEQISRGSQMTSEATASTASAIEEMTVSISHISDNARETESNSQQAAALASEGEQLANDAANEIRRISSDVSATTDLIGGLVDRSREIDNMSAVIKEIADQTNLLALNAAIEAARAGEQGRGFAVVADEVRKLAERTRGATQDIMHTIRAVQSDTDKAATRMDDVRVQVMLGVDLAEKAAQALRKINASTHLTLEKTREVASAAQEQREVSNNIAGNIERIAQMVEEADASVKSAYDQVQQLDELAKELRVTAASFSL